MRRLINIIALCSIFAVLPIMNEMVEEAYWIGHVAEKVEPAMVQNRTVGTTFQIKYKDIQYTMTNLHICRIPNMIEKMRRDEYNYNQIKNKLPPKTFPPLRDKDLVGEYVMVGQYPRQIIAVDKFHDLCILEGNENLSAFSLADSYHSGELIRTIGYPRGLSRTVRKGRIFNKGKTYFPWLGRRTEFVHISAIGYPGNSGSPVVDKYGRVIGVLFAGTRYHTESMIVPLEYVRNFLEKEGY